MHTYFVFYIVVRVANEEPLSRCITIENDTWVRENTRFISSVEHDIMFNPRNKSGISKQPCIFLFII